MKLSEVGVLSIGNTVQMVGAVYAGNGRLLLALFPEDHGEVETVSGSIDFRPKGSGAKLEVHTLNMDAGDWETFVRQTDTMETEVLTKASDGTLAKIVKRKCERQIDATVSWKCFKRDGYRCRYCGTDDAPLTVDHLVTWEDGGPSTTANMLSSCKKCNKTRGNLSYADWLRHPRYLETSKSLAPEVRAGNEAILATLDAVPRRLHVRSR